VDWPIPLQQHPTPPLPTNIAGSSVEFRDDLGNVILGSMYFTSVGQVNVQVPNLAVGTYRVVAVPGALSSNPLVVQVVGVKPNYVQYAGSSSVSYLAVLHNLDGALVTAAYPARAGEYVQLYATGLGATNPPVPAGQAAVASCLAAVTVTINGIPAEVTYAGLQGQYPGLYQINVLVPANVAAAATFTIAVSAPDGTQQTDNFQVE
jgi:uncharacterized protein (TIGR03437 family)